MSNTPEVSPVAQEWLNKEIRRRDQGIRTFPNFDSPLCLIGTILAEQGEDWLE